MHMEFFEDNDDVVCFWRPGEHYEGWVGVMHGGILSTLLDETACWVVFRKLQTSGVTSKLSVSYRKPVMASDSQLTIRAHIKQQRQNLVFIEGFIENANGDVCVQADIVYYVYDEEKAREMGFERCEVEDEQLFSM